MKFGVKTYNSEKFLDLFVDDANFFEVQAIRGNDYSFLKKYSLPIVIHCEHQGFGVNIADKTKEDFNLDAINFAKELANMVGAKKIIIHPGDLGNENCSKENTINFLKKYCDERFCVENMPIAADNVERFGFLPEEMREIMRETGLGFCFDVNHAIEYALRSGVDCWEALREFERIGPVHYHLGGENMERRVSHLNFCDSDLDLKKVFGILGKDAWVTLETTTDTDKVREDLEIVRQRDKFKLS